MATAEEIRVLIDDILEKKLKEKFEEQKNFFTETIDIQFKSFKKEVTDNIKKIEKRCVDLEERCMQLEEKANHFEKEKEEIKDSLAFYENLIDKKTNNVYSDIKDEIENTRNMQEGRTRALEHDFNIMRNKLRRQEDRGRRKNLRIDGIKESERETDAEVEDKIRNLLTDKLKLKNGKSIVIERAHRLGPNRENKTRTVIFKLLNYKEKTEILEAAKKVQPKDIFINEDFSDETMAIRKELWKDVKKARENNKFAVLNYDRIIVREFRRK